MFNVCLNKRVIVSSLAFVIIFFYFVRIIICKIVLDVFVWKPDKIEIVRVH